MLSPLREMADTVLNTSQHTVHQLRDTIVRRFRTSEVSNLQVGIISFGYRYGIPLEADMVVDVRFLPNPNFFSELKHLTGRDPKGPQRGRSRHQKVLPSRQESPLIGIVLVSHGQLASELLRAAEIIVGKIENTVTVDIHPKMGMEEIHTAVEAAIRTVDAGKGVLLFIDMFGGTPSNIGLSFLATPNVEVVTGVNLPRRGKLPPG